MAEHWLPITIKNKETGYLISDMGRVKDKDGELVEPKGHAEGYERICICGKCEYIHRLVMNAFFPSEDKELVVDHINGCRSDNRADNLRWVTKRQNTQRAGREGKLSTNGGRRTPIALENAEERLEFQSQADASRALNIPDCSINKALKGHRLTVRGYKAVYLEETPNE